MGVISSIFLVPVCTQREWGLYRTYIPRTYIPRDENPENLLTIPPITEDLPATISLSVKQFK